MPEGGGVVILGFDIGAALVPDVSLLETVVRGVVTYFSIFILLRVVLRGRTSAVAMSDLLVLVLISDAAQNAMAANYTSITNGVVLVATVILCSFATDWVAYRVEAVRKFVHPDRKRLIADGRVMRKVLGEELMTEDELMTQLRLNGVEEVDEVRAAYLEGNGEVSVIKRDSKGNDSQGKASKATAAG
jgi:uncharacterized membrane protein YcaP (DUF421 family)